MTIETRVDVELRAGHWDAYTSDDPEILVEGGAGTGKTFGILLKRNQQAQEYPGYRGLILRKTARTLASTVLRTFEEEVLHGWDSLSRRSTADGVHFFGGSQNEPASYEYSNGSRIVVGGMDNADKVLGSEYDEIYCNEATELSEEDVETLTGRLRHGVLPRRQLVCDCNPSYETHHLLKRCLSGKMRRIRTFIQDNPRYFNADGTATPLGAEYLRSLESMTGTRRQRFLLGEWVGMENAIYADAMDAQTQLIELPRDVSWAGGFGGMDFGRVHLSAVVAVTRTREGAIWVRECWAGPGDTERIKDVIRSHRLRFKVYKGMTDPNEAWAAQELGWEVVSNAGGPRWGRINRVLSLLENGMLFFDKYGEGVQELWDEMMMYRYESKETELLIKDEVIRKNEDRVAALEDAIACAQHTEPFNPGQSRRRNVSQGAIIARGRA